MILTKEQAEQQLGLGKYAKERIEALKVAEKEIK